ncbi:Uncharacterised protein [Bacteroides xylanisolvens]|nr:Uncharacterised protein [Bacteroides xylanisolvens]
MKEQSVLPGKKRERLSLRDERQEEEPHKAAYKRQLAGPQVGDRFRRHVHQREKKRGQDRGKDAECHRRRFCSHDWVQWVQGQPVGRITLGSRMKVSLA